MNEKDKNKKSSRRNFLRTGGFSIAAIAMANVARSCTSDDGESGEKAKVLGTDGKLVEVDKAHVNHCMHSSDPVDRKKAREGIPYRKFVMVIDLARCANARKCVTKCQEAHHLRGDQEWMKVFRMQDNKNTSPYWLPKTCFHCDDAPCVNVCPVGASYKRSDGLVLVDNEQCIGCKYCMVACPYETRTFTWHPTEELENGAGHEHSPETSLPHKTGTVGKCDFCPDMLRENKLPHCVTACPMGTIYFGDLNEDTVTNGSKTVRFSKLMEERGGYRYMEYFGTKPNVYYLPPVNRSFPFKEAEVNEDTKES